MPWILPAGEIGPPRLRQAAGDKLIRERGRLVPRRAPPGISWGMVLNDALCL